MRAEGITATCERCGHQATTQSAPGGLNPWPTHCHQPMTLQWDVQPDRADRWTEAAVAVLALVAIVLGAFVPVAVWPWVATVGVALFVAACLAVPNP